MRLPGAGAAGASRSKRNTVASDGGYIKASARALNAGCRARFGLGLLRARLRVESGLVDDCGDTGPAAASATCASTAR